jgi:hypothetical protein
MQEPDNSTKEAQKDEVLVIPSAGFATRRPAWCFFGFLGVFLFFIALDRILPGRGNLLIEWGLIAGILAALVVAIWPGPHFMKQLRVNTEGVNGLDRNGHESSIQIAQVEIISVEGFFDIHTFTYEPWGRLHIRGDKQWWAIQFNRVGAKELFATILQRFPNALGISGDQEIIVPVIAADGDIKGWLVYLRTQFRRELGRQIRYMALFSIT